MKNTALRIILCAAFAIILSLNASAQTQAGQIQVAKVEGEVMKLVGGKPVAIKAGEQIVETDTVLTGKNSSVVLVFMNGSSIKLGAESRLAIDEFKMDPLAGDLTLSPTMTGEPSVSKTALNLAYGELVGDVKKLNKSSSYSIKTPVGAAGIRGTIFRVVFRPTSDGKAFFTVSTADGHVVMEGVTTQEIPIDTGKEVVVTVDVPTAPTTPGEAPPPAAAPVVVTQDIPETTKALITEATVTIATSVQQTTFNADTQAAADKAAADKAAADKAAAEKEAADKAAADKAAADKAAADKAAADKAAADKAAADKAAADKAAADKAAADKAAADKAAADKAAADQGTTPPQNQPAPPDLSPGAGG
jgi:hypothetical protein